MGWRQAIRQAEAARRREDREAARRQKELAKQHAQQQKMQERERNENIVDSHENLIQVLTSLHRDASAPVDWSSIAEAPDPPAVIAVDRNEREARSKASAYRPGFFQRLFGTDKKIRAQLEHQVALAVEADASETALLQTEYDTARADLADSRRLARSILASDTAAYREAIEGSDIFAELRANRVVVSVVEIRERAVLLAASPLDEHIVPRTDLKLTAAGKISEKETATATYWARYQDFLCSVALRAVAEAIALLPIERAVCNVGVRRNNSTTGHDQLDCLVAVHATREALNTVNLARVDPSDAMRNFQTRMAFKRASGFESVEKMSLDDQWVTT